jgi:hypothetical protein
MRPVSLSLAAVLLLAPVAAHAQAGAYRSATVAPGKTTRIGMVSALKKDCAIGPLTDVKVVTAPKHGTLNVKSAKVKTPATFRCPNVETPVQGVFYQPNKGYTGADEVKYEIKGLDGNTRQVTVQITVSDKPATGTKDDGGSEL